VLKKKKDKSKILERPLLKYLREHINIYKKQKPNFFLRCRHSLSSSPFFPWLEITITSEHQISPSSQATTPHHREKTKKD